MSEVDERIIQQALTTLHIEHLAAKKVSQLSDGEKQKALIAKALAQDCPVIIMDEPTAFLDYKNKGELLQTIQTLCHTQQKTIIVSTHDIAAALPFADRVYFISESKQLIEADNKIKNAEQLINSIQAL
jgi:iron complex transport system ATP-binding protein